MQIYLNLSTVQWQKVCNSYKRKKTGVLPSYNNNTWVASSLVKSNVIFLQTKITKKRSEYQRIKKGSSPFSSATTRNADAIQIEKILCGAKDLLITRSKCTMDNISTAHATGENV